MASALVGYLALGTVDPVTHAFAEASFAGYVRQPIAFDLDKATAGGAVDTGGNVLRSVNAVVYPRPTALDWPTITAYALFTAVSGGSAQIIVPFPGRATVPPRGTTRRLPVGHIVLQVVDGGLASPFGAAVALAADRAAIVGGALQLGGSALGGTLPGISAIAVSTAPPAASVGRFFLLQPVVSGGYGPQSFALTGALPAGLSFSPATGAISGFPTTAATTSGLAITVTDDSGSAVLSSLFIVVGNNALLTDPDGVYLTDADGAQLLEAA